MASRRGVRALLLTGALVVVLLVATIGVLSYRLGTTRTSAAPLPSASPSATRTPPTPSDVYNQVGPSVVVIRTKAGSLGSGVIASEDGSILTANHVVDDGSAITVLFADGTESRATIAEADAATDIATLTPATLPQPVIPATLGGSVSVGSAVVAIGHPLGLTYSVSTGVVSGLDRTADTDKGKQTGLIQFDASVNPGSSGGPLLDADGNVVGIVLSIADPGHDDAFAGIAFAVPIGTALGGGGGGPRL